MASLRRSLPVLLLAVLMPFAEPVGAEAPALTAPTDRDVGGLEQRLDALSRQIENLQAATNDAVRATLMQQHWLAMQDYMGELHRRFGAGAPWMLEPDAKGGPGASACPMLGGSGAAWPLPEGIDAKEYGAQMLPHMQVLKEQMREIGKSPEPGDRERLLQQHWQTMYRQMQGMRGLGWMWGAGMMAGTAKPGSAAALPDPDSAGAKLVSRYCAQCHPAPAPTLKTGAEWDRVLHRMHLRVDTRVAPIETPSDDELEAMLAYLKQHAR